MATIKIGYPCINTSIGCTANSTFRLANYSEENLIAKVTNNLSCLEKILKFNLKNNLFFFRFSSDLVPFASHPVCQFSGQNHFKKEFKKIGRFIQKNEIRISMHPDQFILINSTREDVVAKSIKELDYHCQVLNLMGLDGAAKVQIHVGGVYGDKQSAIARFVKNYHRLPEEIKKRLVIENDDRLCSAKDCLVIHEKIGIPLIFDSFHHQCLNHGEPIGKAVKSASRTWTKNDGILMVITAHSPQTARKASISNTFLTFAFQCPTKRSRIDRV